MSRTTKEADQNLLKSIIKGIEEVKGNEIAVLDLRAINGSVCDSFVVCDGNSTTQVAAIANKIQEFTQKELNERPWRTEGYQTANWIILDYVNIVVHVFYKESRSFYDIEELWADAEVTYVGRENEIKPDARKANR